jgi:hypothetical protein
VSKEILVFYDVKIRSRFIRNIFKKRRTSSLWTRACAVLLLSFTGSASTTISGGDLSTILIIVNGTTPPEAGFPPAEDIGRLTTNTPNTQLAWGSYGSYTGAFAFLNGAVGARLTSVTANQFLVPSCSPPSAPTISSFTAAPASIASGGSSTLFWSVSGATSLSLNQGIVDVTGLTSKSVFPFATTTYTLTATNSSGSVTASTTVTVSSVRNSPTIASFTAVPASITSGVSSMLSWSVSGATSLSLNQGIGDVTGLTSKSVFPLTTTTYTLTATSSGSVTASAMVTVSPAKNPPTIAFFTAAPTSITSGGSSTLSWSVSGATSLSLNQGVGDVTGLTSKSVLPSATTTYTLTATNSSGVVTASATVTVSPVKNPPTISAFTAAPLSITSGGSSTLSWSVSGATSLSLDQGAGDVTGLTSKSVLPSATTTYTLTATNSSGSVAASATVTVSPVTKPPTISFATSPPGMSFTVDGILFNSSQNFSWAIGSVHSVAVNSPQNGAAGTRYTWTNWSDGGESSHTITAPSSAATYTANFTTQYLLTLTALPIGKGSLAASPAAADGYYANGVSVQITAAPGAGFAFTGFSGDLTGSTNPQSIAMSAPRSVTGSFSGFSTLTVDRAKLNFGTANGIVTSPQSIRVSTGAGMSWSASSNQANISVSPGSGIGSGTFQVTASAGPGGIITVSSPGASASAQIQVNVTAVTPGAPIGSFDTPADNVTGVTGAIPVTGWALENVQVMKVDIWREPLSTESAGSLIYIGDAVFVEGARPDLEGLYPNLPFNYRAGWGYQMLTNLLPPGITTFKLHAVAHCNTGSPFDLGTKTITVDNVHATKPFGSIDTPEQGGAASGNAFVNFGWALAPRPNQIPIDGSTISVVVDGQTVGHPAYNQFRSDIAALFPGYANSPGAVGFFYIDTTKLSNGVHTISWNVFDNTGHGEGIGSRYFSVLNSGSSSAEPEEPIVTEEAKNVTVTARERFHENDSSPVEIDEVGQLELPLGAISGYQVVNGEHRPLPIGSSLRNGVFYWQPGPGFLGEYHLVFKRSDGTKTQVRVKISPKTYSRRM